MMMPHTTGTMNGRTIWKHQATSSATKPMRIAAQTALRTKIGSVSRFWYTSRCDLLLKSCGIRLAQSDHEEGIGEDLPPTGYPLISTVSTSAHARSIAPSRTGAPAKPPPDEALIRALARAHRWKRILEECR